MRCQGCGTQNRDEAIFCGACGLRLGGQPVAAEPSANTSGLGPGYAAPEAVRRWNWGAFFLAVFWTAAHNLWGWFAALLLSGPILGILIGMLAVLFGVFALLLLPLLPFLLIGLLVGLLLVWIYLGARGNELAWSRRRFDSVEHFLRVQRAWKIAGFICFIVFWVLPVIGIGAAAVRLPTYFESVKRSVEAKYAGSLLGTRPGVSGTTTPGFRPAPPPTMAPGLAPGSRESDRQAIRQVLRSFESALARKDRRAFLNMIDPGERNLRDGVSAQLWDWFQRGRDIRASYRDESVQIAGDHAVVTGVFTAQWMEGSSPSRYASRFEMRLRKRHGAWVETGWQERTIESVTGPGVQQTPFGGRGETGTAEERLPAVVAQVAAAERSREPAPEFYGQAAPSSPSPGGAGMRGARSPSLRVGSGRALTSRGTRTGARASEGTGAAHGPSPEVESRPYTQPVSPRLRSPESGQVRRRAGGMRGTRRAPQVEPSPPTPRSDASPRDYAPVPPTAAAPTSRPKPPAVACAERVMKEMEVADPGARVWQLDTGVPLVNVSFSSDIPYSRMRGIVRSMVMEAVKELETEELCIIADVRGRNIMRAEYHSGSKRVLVTDLR